MNVHGRISASMTAEQKAEIKKKIAEIRSILSFAINLTPEDRKVLPKMSDGSIAFVSKALEYAESHPDLVPPYLNIGELRTDFQLAVDLKELTHPIHEVAEMLEDTQLAAGSEAFQVALGFYSSAKNASKAGVPGTDVIVDDLSRRFSGGPVKTEPTVSEN